MSYYITITLLSYTSVITEIFIAIDKYIGNLLLINLGTYI